MKNYKPLYFLMILFLQFGYAQTLKVKGSVVDSFGNPLPETNIVIEGTTLGTQTDANGLYTIEVSRGSVLVFSYLGMTDKKVRVNAEKIDVEMQENAETLGEVTVTTALGSSKTTKSLTYSVQKVSTQELNVARDVNVMSNLQGNVAGLQISPASTGMGGSMRMVLRGNRSLLGNNQPLIVYNGIIVNNTTNSTTGFSGGLDLGSPMEDINASDIRDISVLKGGNSAALYGSLGYNGAMILQGSDGSDAKNKAGIGVTYSTNTYVQVPKVLFKTQNQYGQGQYSASTGKYEYAEKSTTSWGEAFAGNQRTTPAYYDNTVSLPYKDMGNALQGFYNLGVVTMNNVSMEKAGDNYSMRVSYGNTYNKYVIPGSSFDRNQVSMNAKYDFTDYIKTQTFAGYTNQNTTNRNAGSEDQYNVLKYFAVVPRSFSVDALSRYYLNAQGNGKNENSYTNEQGQKAFIMQDINPYYTANNVINADTKDRFMASEQLEIKFYKDLKFKGVAGLDYTAVDAQRNYGVGTYTPRPLGGVDINTYKNFNYNLMAMLEYNKKIADFEINVVVGTMRYSTQSISNNLQGTQFLISAPPLLYNLGNMSTKTVVNGNNIYKSLLVSGFANADISYKDWAYLNLTLRRDWTSAINQGYTYPSVSLSVLPSQIVEALNFSIFDYWKVRASYAFLNNGGDPYRMATTNYATPTPYLNGVSIVRYGGTGGEFPDINYNNPNLRPEETTYYEAGLDFSLLRRRVYLSATYFNMISRDQIFSISVPQSTGYTSRVVNSGEISNSGLEIELKTNPVKLNSFSWNFDVNLTLFRNRIKSLYPPLDRILIDGHYSQSISSYNVVGLPYGQLYGSDYLRNPDGKIYYNTNGLPIANPNNQPLGNTTPDFTVGIRNTFSYKSLSLSVLLDWRQGGNMYSYTNATMTSAGTTLQTVDLRDQFNRGEKGYEDYKQGIVIDLTKENLSDLAGGGTPTKIETVTPQTASRGVEPSAYWGAYSSITKNFIYDASFMKIRELSLGYTFDKDILRRATKGVIQSASLGYVGRNIATVFSNTPNIDPESSFTSGNAQGIEFFSVPVFATHGAKLTIDF